jgi:HlyD family secretion protein
MKKRSTIFAVAGLLAVAAGWRFLSAPGEVRVVRPKKQEVVELVIASGRLRAVRQSDLGPEVAANIDKVFVEEGDRVSAGQTMIILRQTDTQRQLEQARFALETARLELTRERRGPLSEEIERERAELDRARAARELAEKDFERATQLKEKNVLARADWERFQSSLNQARAAEQSADKNLQTLLRQPRIEDLYVAEARVREAEAAVRLAEEQLRKRTIRAPSNGLIVKRQAEPGQSVVPGNVLLTLAQMDKTEIYVETDENNLRKLSVGQKATIVAPAYQAHPFTGRLVQIGPEVDQRRGVVGLRLRPEALPDYARPDMTMDANIEVAHFPDALSLPVSSVMEQDGTAWVLEVRQVRAQRKPVTILGRSAEWIAVGDLEADSLIVARAADARPGQSVRPREVP